MNSHPVHREDLQAITKKESARLLKRLTQKEKFLVSQQDFNIVTRDKVQKTVFLKCHSVFERLVKPVIINSAMESESISPGSGDLSLLFTLNLLSNFINKDYNISEKDLLDNISNTVKENTLQLHSSDINRIISSKTESKHIKSVINSAINLAGSKNKIFVEPGVSEETSIELVKGYFFRRQISEETQCFFNKNRNWEKKGSKVFIVDGDIVAVSDIHYLLESLSEEKRPCMLIARSFSPDVLNTLHANFARGTLNVIPIDIPFDQDTANILVDIATACNTDIVTPLKGDLISKACREKLPDVKSIKVSSRGISITNPSSDHRCHSLLLSLKNRMQNERHFEIREILSRRIASLSGSKVVIKIGRKSIRENPTSVEDTDKILRCISSSTKFGVVKINHTIKDLRSEEDITKIQKIFLNSLSAYSGGNISPAHSLIVAAKKGLSTFNIIKNTSHGLLVGNT